MIPIHVQALISVCQCNIGPMFIQTIRECQIVLKLLVGINSMILIVSYGPMIVKLTVYYVYSLYNKYDMY